MSESSTYRIMANRIRMFVRDWSGDNPPVVFLHHITGNSIEAFRLAKTLNGRRRLVAPDLRGRGQSDMPFGEYGIQAHVRELDAFLDRMELDRPYLVGHSYGATLCIFLAAARPDWFSGVVLMDGGALPHPQALQSLNIYYDHISYRYPSLDAYLDRYRQQPTYLPWTDELEALLRSNLRRQPDGTYIRQVARYVLDADRSADSFAAWEKLPALYQKISCPVLIIRAEWGIFSTGDPVLSDETLKTMQHGMPHAEVVTIPGSGHTTVVTGDYPIRDAALLAFFGL